MKRLLVLLLAAGCASQPAPAPAPAAVPPPAPAAAVPPPARQNPSPMVETTRAHDRLTRKSLAGRRFAVESVLEKPVEVLVTPAAAEAERVDYLIHFHGASWIPMQVAEESGKRLVVIAVNLGAGSGRYSRPFGESEAFEEIVKRVSQETRVPGRIYLSAFSAGYGAIRQILLKQPERIAGVLLLDGLHTSYDPEEKPLADGGKLEESGLAPFLEYARRAVRREKRFVVTHSEIFPGTFASTTETADWLLSQLGIKRTPVVKWGPLGMQQLSEIRLGHFVVQGFAGNTAPDHIDHFHAMGTFLPALLGP